MSILAHHAAFAVSVAAIAGASVRVASAWLPGGPERVLAAAAAGGTAVVLETLLLGLVGLGGSPIALGAAALATWALARSLLPGPEPRVASELAAWWAARGPRERIAWGALAAAFAWWVTWAVIWPPIGFDAGLYQYVEIANWVQGGDPGSVRVVNYEFPVGNYPLGNEVLLAWGAGLAHGWVPLSLLPAAMWALTGLAVSSGLRRLAGTRVAALGAAALLTVPALLGEVGEPDTDLPAVCWLVVAGALTLAGRERPKALVPLLLASGLAIGTKTTVVPLIAVLLVVAWLRAGRPVPARALAVAGFAAAVVGGVWYVRNLVTHGSPFWPFTPGPFGDPTPRWLSIIDNTFLERPRATLGTVPARSYVKDLGASLPLLAAAFVAPLVVRRRAVWIAAIGTGVALLLWMSAPATGVPGEFEAWLPAAWPESAMRYLLPVVAAALVTLALAAAAGAERAVAVVLVLATLMNVVILVDRGSPLLPPLQVAVAALIGAGLVVVGMRFTWPRPHGWAPLAASLVLATVALSLAANGYVERSTGVEESTALGKDVAAWLSKQPGFDDGDEPVVVASRAMVAQLAGDRFRHPLVLVPRRERCERVLAHARRGWLVTSEPTFALRFLGIEPLTSPLCMRGERPVFEGKNFQVYRLR